MECPAQFVEFGFQLMLVDREAAGEAQAGEVIEFFRNRLDLDATVTEIFTGHFRLAVPAHAASHLKLTWADGAMGVMVHAVSSDSTGMASAMPVGQLRCSADTR